MPFAVLFPGQGSQHVGMGADLFAARPDLLGATADDMLGWSLEDLCLNGPETELTRTDRAQPALFATAYALWEAFAAAVPDEAAPAAAAGHSLGEYTALAAAGAFDFATGLRLVTARGQAMAAAAATIDSGMAALLGGDSTSAESLAEACRADGGSLWVANLNAPGQVVVAGDMTALAWAAEHGREHGLRRVIPLKVAGAFHSPLMAPAADELAGALDEVDFGAMNFPVWANADAAPTGTRSVPSDPGRGARGADHANTADALRRQLTSPVRFAETLVAMASGGIDTFIHIGPGDVTAGLVKRTVPDATVHVISTLDDAAAVAGVVG